MQTITTEIRAGTYYDSIVLMQLQVSLSSLPEVDKAGVMMGTETNKKILAQTGLFTEEMEKAQNDDLIVVVETKDSQTGAKALAQIDELLTHSSSADEQEYVPHSLETAKKILPQANWVTISVAGRYAADVAQEALDLGCNVFLYSDNVSIDEEIKLKQKAWQKKLLVMGPDCGTAIIGGVGLGFANHIQQGNIGLIAASGTGLQMVSSRIHQLGGGISQAIGCGGRDLTQEVNAITTRQALYLLMADPKTDVLVLISKPPAPKVVDEILRIACNGNKPTVIVFLGYGQQTSMENVHVVKTLEQAAQKAIALAENASNSSTTTNVSLEQEYIRGLFSGGTLALEVLFILKDYIADLYSNVNLANIKRLPDVAISKGHTIIDLGADEFTLGRLHPMMDQTILIERLYQEAQDPQTAIIVLDVVLGYGAHENPSKKLAPAILDVCNKAKSQGRHLEIIVILVGTNDDPQDFSRQKQQLEQAGAMVKINCEQACHYIAPIIQNIEKERYAPNLNSIQGPINIINIGLKSFAASIKQQQASVVHVDWKPPAGGNEKLMSLLKRMKTKKE